MRQRAIPVVLCIDVEPDARFLDPAAPSPWDGFSATCVLLERFRERAAQRSGSPSRFAWYLRMDSQVEKVYGTASWVGQTYREALNGLMGRGDHMGLHVHACRWVGGQHGWLVDYANQPWIDESLVVAFDAFHRAFGFRCTTFRFGDHWMNQATFERVASLGVEIDLTLEPGYDSTHFYDDSEPITGVLPDYRNVPEHPYLPSAGDYRTQDGASRMSMWEMP